MYFAYVNVRLYLSDPQRAVSFQQYRTVGEDPRAFLSMVIMAVGIEAGSASSLKCSTKMLRPIGWAKFNCDQATFRNENEAELYWSRQLLKMRIICSHLFQLCRCSALDHSARL